MRITISVTPRSSRLKIEQLPDGTYKAWLTSAPADGKANAQLITLLSDHFRVAKSNITITKGTTSKNKIVDISL